jgi:conjugal transfer mating pair stabilization protein TraG
MKGYAVILVWIQLWPPLYAILNYMATIYAQFDLAAAADVGGARVLALQTASPIYNNAVSAEAVVGYLVTAIPFVAWAAVKRMETLGTAIASGTGALNSAVGTSAAATAIGNAGLGNVTMDQRSVSPSTSNPWVSREQQLSGDWFTYDGTGRTAVEKLANRGFASRRVEFRVSEQDVAEANRSTESARAEVVAASTERASALADVYSRAWNRVQDARSQSGTSQSGYEEVAKDLSDVNRAAEDIAARSGATQAQVARALMHVGLGNAIAPVGGAVDKSFQSQLSQDDQKILTYATSQQISAVKRFGDRVTRDRSFVSSIATDDREANELTARLTSTAARSSRAEANYAERVAVAQRVSAARSRGEAISIDIAQDPYNTAMFRKYTEQYGNSAAALVMMQAELARQALGPTHVHGDVTPAFTTPEAVRGSFERNVSSDLSLNPDVEASAALARNDVNRANRPSSRTPTPDRARADSATLRQDVDETERALKQDTADAKGRQQSAAPVATNSRGTLVSGKSLLREVGDQSGEDVTQVGQAAGKAVDDIRNKLLPKRNNHINPQQRN